MAETMMVDAKGGRDTVESRAVTALGMHGVTRILPHLWEAVTFEANYSTMSHREMAKRYLSLLRDYLNGSALDNGATL